MLEPITLTVAILTVLLVFRRMTLARIRQRDRQCVLRGIGQLEHWLSERRP